jgi:hypothetical protein
VGFATIPMGNGNANITVCTASTTAIGAYTVTITGQDTADHGMPNFTSFTVVVGSVSPLLSVTPSSPGVGAILFVGSTSVNVTFTCSAVAGPQGSSPTCADFLVTFAPASVVLSTDRDHPTSVTVTIGLPSQSAHLITPARILATLWLGMPAILLIGSMRFGKVSRKGILRLLGAV